MKKIIINSLVLASMVATGAVSFAQTDGVMPPIRISVPQLTQTRQAVEAARQAAEMQFRGEASSTRSQIQGARQALNAAALQERQNLRTERAALMQNATSTAARKAAMEQFQQKAQQEQASLKSDREAFQQKAEAMQADLKTKREQEQMTLKANLAKIRDAAKQQTVVNLDQRFSDINQKTTSQWTDTLTRLEDLLVKIGSRSDKASVAGKDVSAVTAAIATANADIATAKAAVLAQSGKTYPITVTTDAALKSAVSSARDAMNNDLKAVRTLVQAAHKAVVDAVTELSKIPKVDEEPATAATSAR